MPSTIYVWKSPRAADASEAAAILAAESFEPSDDVSWFARELAGDAPPIWNADAPPKGGPYPDTVVAVPLPAGDPEALRSLLEDVFGLATKYDLIVYEPDRGVVGAPMEAMAAQASATFWPSGAIRSIVATVIALVVAAAAFVIGIPIVSGVVILFALFMAAIFVFTIVSQARERLGNRGG